MPKEPAKAATWGQIKSQLKEFNREQLLALVKDLHDFSKPNRDFLAARFAPADSAAALLTYRQRIAKCFPLREYSSPKLREGRAVIREYQKAASDIKGTLDLMFIYVECGTIYTNEFGDIDEAFYDSLASVLGEIEKLLTAPENLPLFPLFSSRLDQLQRDTDGIGWGYEDAVIDCVVACKKAYQKGQRAAESED